MNNPVHLPLCFKELSTGDKYVYMCGGIVSSILDHEISRLFSQRKGPCTHGKGDWVIPRDNSDIAAN